MELRRELRFRHPFSPTVGKRAPNPLRVSRPGRGLRQRGRFRFERLPALVDRPHRAAAQRAASRARR